MHCRKVIDEQPSLFHRSSTDCTAYQNNRRIAGTRPCQQGTEIGTRTDQHTLLGDGQREDLFIARACQSTVANMADVVTSLDEKIGHCRRKILVQQQSHAVGRNGSSRSRTASAA